MIKIKRLGRLQKYLKQLLTERDKCSEKIKFMKFPGGLKKTSNALLKKKLNVEKKKKKCLLFFLIKLNGLYNVT